MTTLPDHALLTLEEVAKILRAPVSSIQKWCRSGKIPARKRGRSWVVPRWAMKELIDCKPPEATQTEGPQINENTDRAAILRSLGAGIPRRLRSIKPITPWPDAPGVYFVRARDRLKIGVATSVRKRLTSIQTATPDRLELLVVAQGGRREELEFHRRWDLLCVGGEWFRFSHDLLDFIVEARGMP